MILFSKVKQDSAFLLKKILTNLLLEYNIVCVFNYICSIILKYKDMDKLFVQLHKAIDLVRFDSKFIKSLRSNHARFTGVKYLSCELTCCLSSDKFLIKMFAGDDGYFTPDEIKFRRAVRGLWLEQVVGIETDLHRRSFYVGLEYCIAYCDPYKKPDMMLKLHKKQAKVEEKMLLEADAEVIKTFLRVVMLCYFEVKHTAALEKIVSRYLELSKK